MNGADNGKNGQRVVLIRGNYGSDVLVQSKDLARSFNFKVAPYLGGLRYGVSKRVGSATPERVSFDEPLQVGNYTPFYDEALDTADLLAQEEAKREAVRLGIEVEFPDES